MITSLLPYLQTFLAVGNLVIMLWALKTFLSKPHTNLETRVSNLEYEVREAKQSLLQGNDRFREVDDTNEVLIRSLLALIEFEIQYLLQEGKPISRDLEKAKDDLHGFLSKR